jgi:hypothetical protein
MERTARRGSRLQRRAARPRSITAVADDAHWAPERDFLAEALTGFLLIGDEVGEPAGRQRFLDLRVAIEQANRNPAFGTPGAAVR